MSGSQQRRANYPKLPFCWSKDDTCFLLKILQKYPILYDPRHPAYEFRTQRTKVYQKMCNELKVKKPDATPDIIRGKVRLLRRQYLIEKRKMSDKPCRSKLWCYPLMSFFEEKRDYSKNTIPPAEERALSPIMPDENEYAGIEVGDGPQFEEIHTENIDQEKTLTSSQLSSRNILHTKCLQLVDNLTNTFKAINEEREKESERSSDQPPQTFLGLMVESELSKVNDEVYDEAKWKIIRILEEASKRHRDAKNSSVIFKSPALPITTLLPRSKQLNPKNQLFLGNGVKVVMIKGSVAQSQNVTKLNNISIN